MTIPQFIPPNDDPTLSMASLDSPCMKCKKTTEQMTFDLKITGP